MTKVIKGGTIVTADREWKADVLIENKTIKKYDARYQMTLNDVKPG